MRTNDGLLCRKTLNILASKEDKTQRTRTMPTRPKKQMADAAAKYAHNNAHTKRTPSLLIVNSELSHSLSGSHLNDHQVPSSRAARAKLNAAPNTEMARDVVLCELKSMSVLVVGQE
jgi:hypothetical protein